jgi:hypothetical protein
VLFWVQFSPKFCNLSAINIVWNPLNRKPILNSISDQSIVASKIQAWKFYVTARGFDSLMSFFCCAIFPCLHFKQGTAAAGIQEKNTYFWRFTDIVAAAPNVSNLWGLQDMGLDRRRRKLCHSSCVLESSRKNESLGKRIFWREVLDFRI